MLPHRTSKKRRRNKKAAFSSSLPAKTFAQAGRHLIQKCPLGAVPHGIKQGQGCCGAEPGASREQPWCWGGSSLQRMHSAAQTMMLSGSSCHRGFFSGGNAAVSHKCFFSSSQTVFALQLEMQTPSVTSGPARVPSGGRVPHVFGTCSPHTLTCCGIQGEGHQYLDSSDPLLQHRAGIVEDTGSCIDGLEVWPLPALVFTFHLVSSLIHLF